METTTEHKQQEYNALRAWANIQHAIWDLWTGGLQPGAGQLHAVSQAARIINEAMSESAKTVLRAQAQYARVWAEGVAADPGSSKIVVEGAHQAYDLVVACTEAKAEFCDTWLAAVRCLEPQNLAAWAAHAEYPPPGTGLR